MDRRNVSYDPPVPRRRRDDLSGVVSGSSLIVDSNESRQLEDIVINNVTGRRNSCSNASIKDMDVFGLRPSGKTASHASSKYLFEFDVSRSETSLQHPFSQVSELEELYQAI